MCSNGVEEQEPERFALDEKALQQGEKVGENNLDLFPSFAQYCLAFHQRAIAAHVQSFDSSFFDMFSLVKAWQAMSLYVLQQPGQCRCRNCWHPSFCSFQLPQFFCSLHFGRPSTASHAVSVTQRGSKLSSAQKEKHSPWLATGFSMICSLWFYSQVQIVYDKFTAA